MSKSKLEVGRLYKSVTFEEIHILTYLAPEKDNTFSVDMLSVEYATHDINTFKLVVSEETFFMHWQEI